MDADTATDRPINQPTNQPTDKTNLQKFEFPYKHTYMHSHINIYKHAPGSHVVTAILQREQPTPQKIVGNIKQTKNWENWIKKLEKITKQFTLVF